MGWIVESSVQYRLPVIAVAITLKPRSRSVRRSCTPR